MIKLRNLVYLGSAQIIFLLTAYVLNIGLARLLYPADFGVYGIIINYVTLTTLLLTSGIPIALSKFISQNIESADNNLRNALIIQIKFFLIVSLLLFVFSKNIATFLGDSTLTNYFRWSTLIFPLYSLYYIYLFYYNGLHNFKKQSLLMITYSIIKTISIFFFIGILGLYGVIVGLILSPLISLIFGFKLPKKQESFQANKKEMIAFSIPLTLFSVILTLLMSIDLFIINILLKDYNSVGLYNAASILSKIPFYLMSAFGFFIMPIVSSMSNEKEKIKSLVVKLIKLFFILTLPLIIFLGFNSKKIIELFYPPAYNGAALPLSILTVGISAITLFFILSNVFHGTNKIRIPVGILLISLFVSLILNYILIPIFGIIGAAMATTIGGSIALLLILLFSYIYFDILLPLKSILKILISSIIFTLPYFIETGKGFFILQIPILFMIYLFLLIFLKEINKSDLLGILKDI